jgi:ABC-type cobalt transport system substrate-binding protein
MQIAAPYVVRLTPDYDPWAGYEWPDRSGQLERARRKNSAKT